MSLTYTEIVNYIQMMKETPEALTPIEEKALLSLALYIDTREVDTRAPVNPEIFDRGLGSAGKRKRPE